MDALLIDLADEYGTRLCKWEGAHLCRRFDSLGPDQMVHISAQGIESMSDQFAEAAITHSIQRWGITWFRFAVGLHECDRYAIRIADAIAIGAQQCRQDTPAILGGKGCGARSPADSASGAERPEGRSLVSRWSLAG